jgi:hypothetical protein
MALPTITLTNTTGSAITLEQLAVTVPASSSITVSDFDRAAEVVNDAELQGHIVSGDITAEFANTDLAQGAMNAAQSLANVQPITALQIKHSLHQGADPTTGDDELDGYSVGSFWLNTTDGTFWVCQDPTTAAAVWIRVSAVGWPSVLAVDATSGANDPLINVGRSIVSVDHTISVTKGGSYTIRAGDSSLAFGGDLTIRSGTSGAPSGALPLLTLQAGDWNINAGAPDTVLLVHGADTSSITGGNQTGGILLRGGDSTGGGGSGGPVTLRGGNTSGAGTSVVGGKLTLFGGSATAASGDYGGDTYLKAGESLTDYSGNLWMTTSQDVYSGNNTSPIYITTATATNTPKAAENFNIAGVGVRSSPAWGTTLGATGIIELRTGDVNQTTGSYAGNINLFAGSYTGGTAAFGTGPGNINVAAGNTNGKSLGGGDVDITAGNRSSTFSNSGSGGGSISLTAGGSGNPHVGSPAGSVVLTAGASTGTSGYGGVITISAGAGRGTGTGGNVGITAGSNIAGGSASGGNITLTGGANGSSGSGGDVSVVGGTGGSQGGTFRVDAGVGSSTGDGGDVILVAADGGSTSGDGGNVAISGGDADGGGTGGLITIIAGNSVGNNDGPDIDVTAGDGGGANKGGDIRITAGAAGPTSALNPAGGGVTITGGASTAAGGVAGSVGRRRRGHQRPQWRWNEPTRWRHPGRHGRRYGVWERWSVLADDRQWWTHRRWWGRFHHCRGQWSLERKRWDDLHHVRSGGGCCGRCGHSGCGSFNPRGDRWVRSPPNHRWNRHRRRDHLSDGLRHDD